MIVDGFLSGEQVVPPHWATLPHADCLFSRFVSRLLRRTGQRPPSLVFETDALVAKLSAEFDFEDGVDSFDAVEPSDFFAFVFGSRLVFDGDFGDGDALGKNAAGDLGFELKFEGAKTEGFDDVQAEGFVGSFHIGKMGVIKEIDEGSEKPVGKSSFGRDVGVVGKEARTVDDFC